jgi:hypothetical protein
MTRHFCDLCNADITDQIHVTISVVIDSHGVSEHVRYSANLQICSRCSGNIPQLVSVGNNNETLRDIVIAELTKAWRKT